MVWVVLVVQINKECDTMNFVIKKLMWPDGTEIPDLQLRHPRPICAFKERKENRNVYISIDRLDIISTLCAHMVLDNIQYVCFISSRKVWLENRKSIQRAGITKS